MTWMALGCVALGLAPVYVVAQLGHVTDFLVAHKLLAGASLWLTPVAEERASYSPLILFVIILAGFLITFFTVKKFYHGRVRRGPAWDCGYPAQTSRMQDTAEGFGQPIRQIFEFFFGVTRPFPTRLTPKPHTTVGIWGWPTCPSPGDGRFPAGGKQHGRIPIYLLYTFATLIALLAFAR
jgi:hypothetical protein